MRRRVTSWAFVLLSCRVRVRARTGARRQAPLHVRRLGRAPRGQAGSDCPGWQNHSLSRRLGRREGPNASRMENHQRRRDRRTRARALGRLHRDGIHPRWVAVWRLRGQQGDAARGCAHHLGRRRDHTVTAHRAASRHPLGADLARWRALCGARLPGRAEPARRSPDGGRATAHQPLRRERRRHQRCLVVSSVDANRRRPHRRRRDGLVARFSRGGAGVPDAQDRLQGSGLDDRRLRPERVAARRRSP